MLEAQDAYLEARVMTAPPHQLHLMVLDGAIRFAKQAAAGMEAEDYETAHFSLNSSRDFVSELISGLDEDDDTELVDRLRQLFVFVFRSLIDADAKRNPRLIRDALQILEMHRDTWMELIEKLPQENAVHQPDVSGPRSWLT